MNDAYIKACFAKGALRWPVIDAGHLDRDDSIANVIVAAGNSNIIGHRSQRTRVVFDNRRLDNDFAVKIG